MSLKMVLSLVSIVMLIGGILVMRIAFGNRASQTRGVSSLEAMAGTQWMRDDRGRIRWVVPAWIAFWLAMCLVAASIR